jgi:hypothetical protein
MTMNTKSIVSFKDLATSFAMAMAQAIGGWTEIYAETLPGLFQAWKEETDHSFSTFSSWEQYWESANGPEIEITYKEELEFCTQQHIAHEDCFSWLFQEEILFATPEWIITVKESDFIYNYKQEQQKAKSKVYKYTPPTRRSTSGIRIGFAGFNAA